MGDFWQNCHWNSLEGQKVIEVQTIVYIEIFQCGWVNWIRWHRAVSLVSFGILLLWVKNIRINLAGCKKIGRLPIFFETLVLCMWGLWMWRHNIVGLVNVRTFLLLGMTAKIIARINLADPPKIGFQPFDFIEIFIQIRQHIFTGLANVRIIILWVLTARMSVGARRWIKVEIGVKIEIVF